MNMKKIISTLLSATMFLTAACAVSTFADGEDFNKEALNVTTVNWQEGIQYEQEDVSTARIFNCTFPPEQQPYAVKDGKYYSVDVPYIIVNGKKFLNPEATLYSLGFLSRVCDFNINCNTFPKWGDGKAYIMKCTLGYNLCILIDKIACGQNAMLSIELPHDFFENKD
ncbi:MAG: hypothetical protein RUMPE_00204 [Eubacteriales bacterium SKADARSKE-1]|nr:hypothetical protein [Eubacteriales bacterium SKADARSKE-1]